MYTRYVQIHYTDNVDSPKFLNDSLKEKKDRLKILSLFHTLIVHIYAKLYKRMIITYLNSFVIEGIRSFIERMVGYFVYVSNTTSKDDGYLCYHDESTEQRMLSEDQHINCSLQGRFVIYYNERRPGVKYPKFYSQFAYNELCEVEVYGESDIIR